MNETLKVLREKNNFSQQKIAEILGISRQMYIKYENGDVEPPLKTLRELCSLYDVSYECIINNQLAPKSINYEDVMNRFEKSQYLSVAEPAFNSGFSLKKNFNSASLPGMSVSVIADAVSKFNQTQKDKILELLNRKSELKEKRLSALKKYAGSCADLWPEDAVEYQNSIREDR